MSTAPLSIYNLGDYILSLPKSGVNSKPEDMNKLCIQCQKYDKKPEIFVPFDGIPGCIFPKSRKNETFSIKLSSGNARNCRRKRRLRRELGCDILKKSCVGQTA